VVGLTQSAMTRQVQGVEARLGFPLFERTTRKVQPTAAGRFLLGQSQRILGDVEACLRQLREQFSDAPKQVRVGVSQTISLAYLPGFFAPQQRGPEMARLAVSHLPSGAILEALESSELDIGVLCPPKRLPTSLRVAHRFSDAFTLIVPREWTTPETSLRRKQRAWSEWLGAQPWLLLHERSNTGARLRRWLARRGWSAERVTELDNFDLIINLVALGFGVSVVPQRALALYGRSRKVQRFSIPERFERELLVLTRRLPPPPVHVMSFVEGILF
jgi:DNA-binding transcriptional LysR family regulator